jgi:excisionase family DNA binding protein
LHKPLEYSLTSSESEGRALATLKGFLKAIVENGADNARAKQVDQQLTQDWYTVREAASVLDAHEKTVRRWIAEGRIKPNRPSPRKTKIHKTELARFLLRRES